MITKKEADTINQNYFNNNISKQKPKVSDSSDKNEITVEEANKINQNYFNQTPTVEEGSFGKSIGEFITGNEREARFNPQNLPEFSSAVVNQMSPLDPMKTPTKLGLATTFDQEAQQQIIEKQFPSAKFKDVGDGYMQIDYDGKQYVLNRAGLTASDIESVVGTVVPFGAAARAANKLVKSSSTGIKMLAQLLGQGEQKHLYKGHKCLLVEKIQTYLI